MLSQETLERLKRDEIIWHYSVHSFTENIGQEVLENILSLIPHDGERRIVGAQIRDELRHVEYFKKLLDKFGRDDRANFFADSVKSVVLGLQTLSEKVFAFQIIIESISAAFCAWRRDFLNVPEFRDVDQIVLFDEARHLKMGHSLLKTCNPEEWSIALTSERRKNILKQINSICRETLRNQLVETLIPQSLRSAIDVRVTHLDSYITRKLIAETMLVQFDLTG